MPAPHSPQDATPNELSTLILAAQNGDRSAMAELCESLYPKVRAIAHERLEFDVRRGRPWLTAILSTGDIVQEIFMGVIRDLEGFRGRSERDLCAFIGTLTRNRLIDTIRFHQASRRDRRRAVDSEEQALKAAAGPSPAELLAAQEEIRLFHSVLRSFNQRDRALLRGRLEASQAYEDLAAELGYASADSARKAFHVAQARLLTRLRRGR